MPRSVKLQYYSNLWKHNKLPLLAFALAGLVLIGNAVLMYLFTRNLVSSSDWVEHTIQVRLGIRNIELLLSRGETARRSYVATKNEEHLHAYDQRIRDVRQAIGEMQTLLKDNPQQIERMERVQQSIDSRISLKELLQNIPAEMWLNQFPNWEREKQEVNEALQFIDKVEADLLEGRKGQSQAAYQRAIIAFSLASISALTVIGVGLSMIQRDVQVRKQLLEEREKFTTHQELALAEQQRVLMEQEKLSAYNTMLLESSGEGIYGVDLQGNCTFINGAALKILKLSREQALKQNMHQLLHHTKSSGEIYPEDAYPIAATLKDGTLVRLDDDQFIRADGVVIPVEFSSAPMRFAGMIQGAVITFNDITQRKANETVLKAAVETADAANLAKSQFLANMSHELRTPLNAVILYSELLQEEAEDRGVVELVPDLEKIRIAGRHLLSLINSVLDLSKIEAGKMDLYLETFEVEKVVQEVCTTATPLVEKKHNKLEIKVATEVGSIHADVTKVRQILFNLLSNSAKFSENGVITVEVARRDDRIDFHVRDTGIGMNEEQMAKLFRPFSQGDESTTRKYGGTGLGLTISRRFAELMGGTLTAKSQPNQGSEFTFTVPVMVQPVSDTTQQGTSAGGNRVALVIDDEEKSREILVQLLHQEGITALVASDGELGVKLAREKLPDLIFLDVIMPKMDGWAVLSALKSEEKLADIPVIMVTVAPGQDLGFMLGANEFLTKPVEETRLLAIIRKYISSSSQATILVIDDDASTREVFSRMLTREGWKTETAVNGKDGLEQAEKNNVALVLLDLVMPIMDGFEFLKQFRSTARGKDVPIVVLTSKDLSISEREALQGQVESVLKKGDCRREDLLKEIRVLTQNKVVSTSTPSNSTLTQ